MTTKFSAGGQSIGYIYQVRYALNLILSEKNIDKDIAIEQLDDVHFSNEGTVEELIQLKHSISKKASLSNSSGEFWKTIRVWSELTFEKKIKPVNIVLTLITTATASEDSICSFLRMDHNRNPKEAVKMMLDFIKTSESEVNKVNFDAFTKLSEEDRFSLVNSIQIIDNTPNILNVPDLIKQKLKVAVRRAHLDSIYERLEGWWFNRVIENVARNSNESISGFEVQDYINEVRDQFSKDSLPIDYRKAVPTDINAESDSIQFIEQLKLISLSNRRIEQAIHDYYRAFTQRSRWIREDLVFVGELEQYEDRLLEEWDRQFEMIMEDEMHNDELLMKKRGKELYNKIQELQINIRKNCIEPYVMRGTYHILADKSDLILGWHPDFVNRLKKLLIGKRKVI
ncbi:hypothetical protein P9265_18655 [Schinkia azotoformans]|uniref:ABC-three component system protein n=1 Tax=Schinkia azotoformans TaxID=1454 RepID=UPI002E1CC6EA|nr:hypothetical protein [Schinkia azotoformans]